MRLHLDSHPTANLVTHLGPQGIRVGERNINRSVILSASQLVEDWEVGDPDALVLETLAPALEMAPGILVLGTGDRARFPDTALFAALAERGIGLEVMDTAAACRTYNVLVGEDRPVVAALILP